MIQHIKKIVTFLILTVSIIIFGNCKENIKKIEKKDDNSDTILQQTKLADTVKGKIEAPDYYKLIDVARFFDKPIEESDLKEYKQMSLKINKDNIYLTYKGNQGFLPYQLKSISAQKYFGKGSLYEYYTGYLINKYNIDVNKEITYLQIGSTTPLSPPFKTFFYKNYTVITDKFVFLYSYEDYLLIFEKESKDDLNTLYNSLDNKSLPLYFDFNFIVEKPDFKSINDSYGNFLGLNDLRNFKGIALPNASKNIKVLLISANQESGENNMYLYTLTKDYRIIEKFDLSYIESETDSGKGIGRQIDSITKNYTIKMTDISETGEEIKKTYKINDSGNFVEQK